MTKIIQTRVDANGDVHLDFSGFVGHDCATHGAARVAMESASANWRTNDIGLPPEKSLTSIVVQR